MKYRKKPIVIEAFLLGVDKIPDWFEKAAMDGIVWEYEAEEGQAISIYTLEGRSRADYGKDYIVRGVRGELYPCKKEIFEETYEKVED